MEIRFTNEERGSVLYLLAKRYNGIYSVKALDEMEAACNICSVESLDIYIVRATSGNIYYGFDKYPIRDWENIAKIKKIKDNLYKAILL